MVDVGQNPDAIVFTPRQALFHPHMHSLVAIPTSMAEICVFDGKSWRNCHALIGSLPTCFASSPIFLWFPLCFLWFSQGFPKVFPWFSWFSILPCSVFTSKKSPAPRVAPLRLQPDLGVSRHSIRTISGMLCHIDIISINIS